MEHLVVDSNILVASFLESDSLHQKSQPYIIGLENDSYIFHLPVLVIGEVISAISRQSTANRLALLARADQSLRAWEQSGQIVVYPIDRERLDLAVVNLLSSPHHSHFLDHRRSI